MYSYNILKHSLRGVERANHKYIGKVQTSSGKVKYIYDQDKVYKKERQGKIDTFDNKQQRVSFKKDKSNKKIVEKSIQERFNYSSADVLKLGMLYYENMKKFKDRKILKVSYDDKIQANNVLKRVSNTKIRR